MHHAVPHNITLFVEFEIIIVPESICGLFIDQRSKVLPVVVIPCVYFGTPSLCDLHISVFSMALSGSAQSLLVGLVAPLVYQSYHIQKIKVINNTGTSSLLNKTYRNSQLSTNCSATRFVAVTDWA
jgi:hypothetical protein